MPIRFILFLSLFFFVPRIQAASHWFARSDLNGRILVEEFARSADGWQDLIDRQTFATDEEATRYLQSIGQTSIDLSEAPPQGRELQSAAGVLWDAKEKWSLDWEKKYAEWIAHGIDPQFWVRNKIATDCADVLYSLRWIFARMNKLEMASRLTGSGDYLTNRSLRGSWASLPTAENWYEDRRFLAALNYLLDNTFTHSLMNDSYPIAITREAVTEGVYHLDLHEDTGHTQIVYRTDQEPDQILPFIMIQSTVPRKVRELMISGFWYVKQPLAGQGGLLRMRWPVFKGSAVSLAKSETMPFYSKEQYDKGFMRDEKTPYYQEVYLRLNPQLDFKKVLDQAYENLRGMFRDRVAVVNEGYRICGTGACPRGSQAYEDWSTPSRDGRILDLYNQTRLIAGNLQIADDKPVLTEPFLELEGEKYALRALLASWWAGRFSSEPGDRPDRRWGVSAASVAEWATDQATSLTKAREQKLRKNQASTAEDGKLLQMRAQLENYCAVSPLGQCLSIFPLLEAARVSVQGKTLSLRSFQSLVPWMSPYPDQGSEKQWGAHEKNYSWFDTALFSELSFTNEGLAWMKQADGVWSVLDLSGTKPRAVAQGKSQVSGISAKGGLSYEAVGNRLRLSPAGAAPLTVDLDFEPNRSRVFGRAVLFFSSETKRYILGWWTGETFEVLAAGTATSGLEAPLAVGADANSSMQSKNPEAWFVCETGKSRLWDFSGPAPRFWDLNVLAPNTFVRAQNSQWIVLSGSLSGLFLKETSRLIEIPELKNAILFQPAGRSGFILKTSNGQMSSAFFTFGSDGHFNEGANFSGVPHASGESYRFQDPKKHYLWSESDLAEIVLRSDEDSVVFARRDFLITRLKSSSLRLRKGNTNLFEIKGSIRLMDSEGPLKYFEVFDWENQSVSVREIQSPQTPVMKQVLELWPQGFQRAPEVGAITSWGIWLK